MEGLQLFQPAEIFLRYGGGKLIPGAGHILAGHVDDPLRQPVLPVGDRQQFRIGSQAGPAKRAGGEQREIIPQERGRVGIAVQGHKDVPNPLFMVSGLSFFSGSGVVATAGTGTLPWAKACARTGA